MKYKLGNLEYLDKYIYIVYEKVKKFYLKDFYEDDIYDAFLNIYIKLRIYADEKGVIQIADSRRNTDNNPSSTEDSKPSTGHIRKENTTRKEGDKTKSTNIQKEFYLYFKRATKNGLLDKSKKQNNEAAAIEGYSIITPNIVEPWAEKPFTLLFAYKELGKLPERQRKAFLLKYRDNYTNKEIGEMLGIEESTVKSTIRAAKKNLQENIRGTSLDDII